MIGLLVAGAAVAAVLLVGSGGSDELGELERLAETGDPFLDQADVRSSVVRAARDRFGATRLRSEPELLRALVAIVNNETNRRVPLTAQVGDQAARTGPSVGPMQVSRGTAQELGLWQPQDELLDRDTYAELAADLDWCYRAGVAVFARKLQLAGGDVAEALRRYNGSGPMAEAYRDRALAFIQRTFEGAA